MFVLAGLVAHCSVRGFAGEPFHFFSLDTGSHVGAARGVGFIGPDSFATFGDDRTVRFWSGGSLKLTFRYGGYSSFDDGIPSCFATAPGKAVLGLQSVAGTGELLEFDDKGTLKTRLQTPHEIMGVAFSRDGTSLATSDISGALTLRDVKTLAPKTETNFGETDINGNSADLATTLAFSQDGKALAGLCKSAGHATVFVWRPGAKPILFDSAKGLATGAGLAWIGSKQIAFAKNPSGLGELDIQTGKVADIATSAKLLITSIAVKSGGSQAVVGTNGSQDALAQLETVSLGGGEGSEPVPSDAPVQQLAMSSDGSKLVAALADGSVEELDPGSLKTSVPPHRDGSPVINLSWCNEGKGLTWLAASGQPIGAMRNRAFLLDEQQVADANAVSPDAANSDSLLPIQHGVTAIVDGDGVIVGDGRQPVIMAAKFAGGILALSSHRATLLKKTGGSWQQASETNVDTGYPISGALSPDGKLFATGGKDGTIRIWSEDSLKDGLPMLTLFVEDDGEWVVWNPSKGYYSASPEGDKVLAVQTDKGPMQNANIATAERIRAKFYNPKAISDTFGTGQVQRDEFQSDALSVIPRTADLQVFPADSALQTTAEDGVFKATTLHVKLSAVASEKITSVRVIENVLAKDAVVSDQDQFSLSVDLQPGRNRVTIEGSNDQGFSSRVVLLIDCEPAGSAGWDGTLQVLSVGVGGYGNGIQQLKAPPLDATAVYDFFAQAGRLPGKGHADKSLDPTSAELMAKLKALSDASSGDDLLLYLSGHGYADTTTGHYYFLTKDANLANLATTAIDWDQLMGVLQQSRFRNVLIVADACFSGGAVLSQVKATQEQQHAGRDVIKKKIIGTTQANIAVLASSDPFEVSYEDESSGNSIFTKLFLQTVQARLATSKKFVLVDVNFYTDLGKQMFDFFSGKNTIQVPMFNPKAVSIPVAISTVAMAPGNASNLLAESTALPLPKKR